MWSRRDQIQAYQFVRRRTVSALLVGDANHAESPTRLPVSAVISGAVVVVLMLAGFGIVGILRPGSSSAWNQTGVIVEEKESGAQFVLLDDADGAQRLHPVTNHASALLLAGGGTIVSQSRNSLASAPLGAEVGIPGAPDAVPDADHLVRAPWTVCTTVSPAPDTSAPRVLVILGAARDSARRVSLEATGQALVVDDGSGLSVVADGLRHPVPSNQDLVLRALGLDTAPVLSVGEQWLAALPVGPPFAFGSVPRIGHPTTAAPTAGARVGQLFQADALGGGRQRYFQLLTDGLAELTLTQAQIALASARIRAAYPGEQPGLRPLSPAELDRAALSSVDTRAALFPDRPLLPTEVPAAAGEPVQACLTPLDPPFTSEQQWSLDVTLLSGNPVPEGANLMAAGPESTRTLATAIATRTGTAALVRSSSGGTDRFGGVYLVTDQGRRFAIPPDDGSGTAALTALGFGGVTPTLVPQQFVTLLPSGPALDVDQARRSDPSAPDPTS